MKTIKFITIYPEVYDNKDLTPNEKIYLSVIHFFTKGKAHCCKLSDQEMSEELLIGVNQIRKIKCKLKKLGLITIGENCIKYVLPNSNETLPNSNETLPNSNETLPNSNETLPNSNETLPNSNETLPNSNETLPNSNETLPNSNETLPNSNETLPNSNENPCNTNENQQVTEGKDIKNKKEIKKEKNKKEIKKEKQEKESFLDDWEREALLKKKEYKDNSSNNSNSDSCTVVDMVMGLPVKDDVSIKDEPENKIETDRNAIIDTLAKKMVDKISYSIRTQVNQIKHECDKQMFLKENEFNELQLTKHIKSYLKDRNLDRILQDVTVFDRFAINAFNSYKNEIKRTITKLPKNNPYSDLDGSNVGYNEYKETNRWLN